jgi:hypothetical protein
MGNILKSTLIIFFLNLTLASCADNAKKNIASQKPLNPNGDSELALLMRDMYDEALSVKKQIKNGEDIEITLNHEDILTAHATEPEKANSAEFKAFAKSYLQTIENIKLSSPEERLDHYNSMVTNCIACHQTLCPGPLVRINKLKNFN